MCGRSTGTYKNLGDLQRDLRNLNLGDLKKGPNGGVSPTPQKNYYNFCLLTLTYITTN
jgi:predicted transcriptional regulator